MEVMTDTSEECENQSLKGRVCKTDEAVEYIYWTDTVFDLVRKRATLTYNVEGLIMIFQPNQHLIHYFYYIIHAYFKKILIEWDILWILLFLRLNSQAC